MVKRTVGRRVLIAIRRFRRFVFNNILHANDPPWQLALGAAIGMFVTFTPTVGFQMLLVVFLAWLFKANKAIGLPIVWISNPATVVPIFYACYVVGRVILQHDPISVDWWQTLANPPADWWPKVSFYWSRLMEIAGPLWVGCLFVASIMGYVTYYGTYHAIRWYRLRRWGQLTPPVSAAVPTSKKTPPETVAR
jgi:uncharacterized protein (DUF2062 family)